MAIDTTISTGKALVTGCFLGLIACSQQTPQMSGTSRHPGDTILISAVGDIMLGGTSEPVFQDEGYDYAFAKVKTLLADSDIVIGNLEGPLTQSDKAHDDKEYLFRSPPALVAPALKRAGFNIMNLANNHIMDFGADGLHDTLHALHQNGINTVGAGDNLEQARQGTIMNINNNKIGFLSYSLTFPESFWASDNRPGTAFGHEHQIREDIRKMKESVDLLVVSYHWGQEKSSALREYQPILAHAAIDEGAALVIGHHPHVLQAIEKYKHGVIMYSLGNFTFGSYSRTSITSMVATAVFKNAQFQYLELVPINVLNIDVNFQPYPLKGEEADLAIEELNQLSMQQNTRLSNNNGVAYLYNNEPMSESVSILH